MSWKGTGFSDQSVPSLSNVAIRSGTGTKSGEPSLVTFSTKATMAFLGAVSFQEGSGSCAGGALCAHERTSAPARRVLGRKGAKDLIRRRVWIAPGAGN